MSSSVGSTHLRDDMVGANLTELAVIVTWVRSATPMASGMEDERASALIIRDGTSRRLLNLTRAHLQILLLGWCLKEGALAPKAGLTPSAPLSQEPLGDFAFEFIDEITGGGAQPD